MAFTEYQPTALPELTDEHRSAQAANGLLFAVLVNASFIGSLMALNSDRTPAISKFLSTPLEHFAAFSACSLAGGVALASLFAWGTLNWSSAEAPERVRRGAQAGLGAFLVAAVTCALAMLFYVYVRADRGQAWTPSGVVTAMVPLAIAFGLLGAGLFANWKLIKQSREPLAMRFEQHHSPAPEDPLRFREPERPAPDYPPPPDGVRFLD